MTHAPHETMQIWRCRRCGNTMERLFPGDYPVARADEWTYVRDLSPQLISEAKELETQPDNLRCPGCNAHGQFDRFVQPRSVARRDEAHPPAGERAAGGPSTERLPAIQHGPAVLLVGLAGKVIAAHGPFKTVDDACYAWRKQAELAFRRNDPAPSASVLVLQEPQ